MRAFCVILLIAILSAPAPGQSNSGRAVEYAPVAVFDPARDAAKDIDDAVGEAGRTNRRVLLDVGGEWCIWCRRLDSLFVKDKALSGYLNANYVAVKINYSRENKNEEVLSRYPKIKGYPHLFVLDAGGIVIHSQDSGELEKGKGYDPEKVMAFLKRWSP